MIALTNQINNDLDPAAPYTHVGVRTLRVDMAAKSMKVQMAYGKVVSGDLVFADPSFARTVDFTFDGRNGADKLKGKSGGANVESDLPSGWFDARMQGDTCALLEQDLVSATFFVGTVV